jgi:hypothetical protein|uniref:Uncharacterized protein n=1 Tax=Zea mays TaxID=4577 RepID=C0P3G8_MAIZE|nr:unknown [Zea mays]
MLQQYICLVIVESTRVHTSGYNIVNKWCNLYLIMLATLGVVKRDDGTNYIVVLGMHVAYIMATI